jgi:5-methylcytosine-specific restriction endonuclease McrA
MHSLWCNSNREKVKKINSTSYLKNGGKYKSKRKKYSAEWYQENKIRLDQAHNKWRNEHKDVVKKWDKRFRKTEEGKARMARSNHKRKALLKNKNHDLTLVQWKEIIEKQNHKCAYCGKPDSEIKLTRDCIVPVSKGGYYTKNNVQALCISCNSKKSNKIDSQGFQLVLGGAYTVKQVTDVLEEFILWAEADKK